MNAVSTLVLCKANYKNEEEFFKAIQDAVKLLLEANYIMTVRYDEPGLGIVCIEYNHAESSLGGAYPYWLLPEEIEQVERMEG